MNRLLITFSLTVLTLTKLSAQFGQNNAIYISNDFNVGNYYGVDISLNYMSKEKYSIKAGYSHVIRTPKTQPSDYSSGGLGTLFLGAINPYDQLNNYQLAIGRVFILENRGFIRLNVMLGFCVTTITEPENWKYLGESDVLENYSWNYYEYNTFSVYLNPKLEFPVGRFYGFSISPIIQLNKDRIFYGIGFGQIFGLLRKKES